MKLIGRSNDRGYIVELSYWEFTTLNSLAMALDGKPISDVEWEPKHGGEHVDLSSAFDAIFSYSFTLSSAYQLKRLADEAYEFLKRSGSAEVLVPDLPGETKKYLSRPVEPEALEVGEVTRPFAEGRFEGMAVGRDSDGFFVFNHRQRSASYPTLGSIPEKQVFVFSRGGYNEPLLDALRQVGKPAEQAQQGYNPLPTE